MKLDWHLDRCHRRCLHRAGPPATGCWSGDPRRLPGWAECTPGFEGGAGVRYSPLKRGSLYLATTRRNTCTDTNYRVPTVSVHVCRYVRRSDNRPTTHQVDGHELRKLSDVESFTWQRFPATTPYAQVLRCGKRLAPQCNGPGSSGRVVLAQDPQTQDPMWSAFAQVNCSTFCPLGNRFSSPGSNRESPNGVFFEHHSNRTAVHPA
jgi:hypothetical protein